MKKIMIKFKRKNQSRRRTAMKITLRIISIILLISTFVVIFQFSAQDGKTSGGLSNRITTEFVNRFFYFKILLFNLDKKRLILLSETTFYCCSKL